MTEVKTPRKKAVTPKAPPVPPTVQEIAANLKARFINTAAAHANEADVEQVMTEVIKDLNAAKRAVTLKMMGLDNRWGNWEVDHCNGRTSPITEYLTDTSKTLIKNWVNDAIKEVLTTEVEAKLKKQLADAFRKELYDLGGYKTREMISDKVHEFIARLLKKEAAALRAELDLGGE